jgi:phosphatidylglycerol lysyltransferase
VDTLSAEWTGSRRAGVGFGWLFGVEPFSHSAAKKYFAARTPDGALVGVLAASPIPARDGWYLEDVLRSRNAPDGTSDLLVVEALRTLAAGGAKLATLGTVPLSEKGEAGLCVGHNRLVERAFRFSRKRLNRLYNFEGLGHFKSKFVPCWWENEYVVVTKGHVMPPRVANALFNVLLPGGLIQIIRILLSGNGS